jgi:hypothetical protein
MTLTPSKVLKRGTVNWIRTGGKKEKRIRLIELICAGVIKKTHT